MARILLVGALSGDLATVARLAGQGGALVKLAGSVTVAMSTLRQNAALDVIICDMAAGVAALIGAMRAERMSVRVIAVARDMTAAQATMAIQAGACDVVSLPADPEILAALLVAAALPAGQPVMRDPAMLAVLRRAEQIATSDASVLITGDSGTGKEVLARIIHARSRRAQGPFVALNCAAIPENLLESELFGHEKGAFSGAIARRLGKFEAAHGGTLLLDEISEMDIRLQAKLLRAIQEREIDRVGGTAPVRINVRILATSNRNLAVETQAGRFREDLYFRLNVVGLRIPRLQDRPADIPALAQHFARYYAEINGLPQRVVAQDALLRLTTHAWRGNVRELENTLHRAVLLADGDLIGANDIELSSEGSGAVAPVHADNFVGRRMDDVEREHILQTLTHTAGNRTHAAVMLGISIRALRNKLKDYAQAGVAVPPPQAGVAA
jgi:DNA-binding NtrC family response regulator